MNLSVSAPNLPGFNPQPSPGLKRRNTPTKRTIKQGILQPGDLSIPTPTRTLRISQDSIITRDREKLLLQSGRNQVNDAVLKANIVLKFDCYFKEAVNEAGTGESYRVRKCHILFYLDGNHLQVIESKQENSGIPQGDFVKRHQVPKENGGFIGLDDLGVDEVISVYGRRFHIVGCNRSTADYLRRIGRHVPANIGFPADPYETSRGEFMSRETGADFSVSRSIQKNPMKKFAEATLGNTVNNGKLGGFLNYGRKVLSFSAVWDDRQSLYGELLQYQILFYLADDQVEVLEVQTANCGRDPFPKLLKKQKLRRNWLTEDANGRADEDDQDAFYQWQDFAVGNTVNVYSRNLLVVDCDGSTREFFRSNNVPLGDPVDVGVMRPERKVPQHKVAEFNGWGTPEDSIGSCLSLVPKAPKTQFDIQGPTLSKMLLRYSAKLTTGHPDDQCRNFTITFFVEDSTIQIIEQAGRNTGIMGGKFLARSTWTNPATGKRYSAQDFTVGAEVQFTRGNTGYGFKITDVDEATLRFMEGQPARFPLSNPQKVMAQLITKVEESGGLHAFFRKVDDDFSGNLTIHEFSQMIESCMGEAINPQILITLMRTFDVDGNGKINSEEFCTGMQKVYDMVASGTNREFEKTGSNDDYIQRAQDAASQEEDKNRVIELIFEFGERFKDGGNVTQKLVKLAELSNKTFISRSSFLRGISISRSAADSDTFNMYFRDADAWMLADAFFGKEGHGRSVQGLECDQFCLKMDKLIEEASQSMSHMTRAA
jgi:hypothetical protein